jgi:DNA-binding MarR family transcriptional regulator
MVRKTPNEFEESRRRVTKLMKRILVQSRILMEDKLRPYGTTTAQIRLLLAIRTAPGSSGAQLARQCEVTPQTAQALIERAERAGWIVRGKDSVNERILTAALTPAGEKLLKTADRLMRGIETKLWKDIEPEKLHKLEVVLESCLRNIG